MTRRGWRIDGFFSKNVSKKRFSVFKIYQSTKSPFLPCDGASAKVGHLLGLIPPFRFLFFAERAARAKKTIRPSHEKKGGGKKKRIGQAPTNQRAKAVWRKARPELVLN